MVGDLVTSLGMPGFSLTLVALDDELLRWWDAPAVTPDWAGAVAAPAAAPVIADTVTTTSAAAAVMVDPWISQWARGIVDTVGERSGELGELDRLAGDGDFGDNLATAASRVDLSTGAHPLVALADAFASIGGSSGPMLAVWFSGIAGHLGADADGAAVAAGLAAGAGAVTELGGAHPGDRTMIDAMVPAAEAAAGATESATAAMGAAAAAAQQGADRTSGMVGKRGRASYLGDSVTGAPDPGAVAVALFLAAAKVDGNG